MNFHVFWALILALFFSHTFDGKWRPKASRFEVTRSPFWRPFRDLFRTSTFGCILVARWLPFYSLWAPIGSLLTPFGSLLIHFSSILCCSLLSLYFLGLLSLVSGLAAFISESSYEFLSIRILISVSGRIFL